MTGWIATPNYVLARENAVLWGWRHAFEASVGDALRNVSPVPHGAPHAVESRRAVTLSSAAAELPVSA